jgi:hypothetical protein
MKRFTGHQEPWGEFVDVKINAPELLSKEILKKKKRGNVWVSGVCDPYQPLEAKYQLTRRCLAILAEHNWPVNRPDPFAAGAAGYRYSEKRKEFSRSGFPLPPPTTASGNCSNPMHRR